MDLSELRASARSKADEESQGFINNTALDRFINEGHRFLYNKIVASYDEYFETEGTLSNGGLISVSAGTHKYTLPTTLQKLAGVEWRGTAQSSENDWIPMDRVERKNRNRLSYFTVPRLDAPFGKIGYYSTKTAIYLTPVPTGSFTMRLWFVPRAVALADVSDVPESPEEFHELIADFAAMRCLGKSGEGIWKEMQDMFTLQMNTFMETVGHRDIESATMVITDLEGAE